MTNCLRFCTHHLLLVGLEGHGTADGVRLSPDHLGVVSDGFPVLVVAPVLSDLVLAEVVDLEETNTL